MTKTLVKAKAELTAVETPVKKGWRIKAYYVDKDAMIAAKPELDKAPNQVRIMMAHFVEIASTAETAAQGRILCQSAIDKGGLKTVIEPHVLFAYYRSTMEKFGLRLKG
jgi:hypothetical protein